MTKLFYNSKLSWLQPMFYRWVKWRYRKPRWINKRGIDIYLLPTVFHPSIYLSTDLFLDFLLDQKITESSILELGAGSGFISLYMAKHAQCAVTASDINPAVVEGLQESMARNDIEISAVRSDLFDNIESVPFDYILINPPYYNSAVKTVDEYAFFCGSNYEYFDKLFSQLSNRQVRTTTTYMILSSTADITSILKVADRHKLHTYVVFEWVNHGEVFYIYEVIRVEAHEAN